MLRYEFQAISFRNHFQTTSVPEAIPEELDIRDTVMPKDLLWVTCLSWSYQTLISKVNPSR